MATDWNRSVDSEARDLAFEINLGGDRFSPEDVAAWLNGSSPEEIALFRRLVEYHAADFAPAGGYRDPGFMGRSLDAWLSGVVPGEGNPAFRKALESFLDPSVCDRGRWFRLPDGSLRRCDAARRAFVLRDVKADPASLVPVKPADLLREAIHGLVAENGDMVRSDGFWMERELMSAPGQPERRVFVRESVDVLAKGIGDHVYTVTDRSDDGGFAVSVSELSESACMEYFYMVSAEAEFLRLARSMEEEPSPAVIMLDSPVSVVVGWAGLYEVDRVVVLPGDGAVSLYGRDAGGRGREIPLDSLTDVGLESVRKATEGTLRSVLARMERPARKEGRGMKM